MHFRRRRRIPTLRALSLARIDHPSPEHSPHILAAYGLRDAAETGCSDHHSVPPYEGKEVLEDALLASVVHLVSSTRHLLVVDTEFGQPLGAEQGGLGEARTVLWVELYTPDRKVPIAKYLNRTQGRRGQAHTSRGKLNNLIPVPQEGIEPGVDRKSVV